MAKFEGHNRLHPEDRELILSDFYSSFLLIENESELQAYLADLLSEPELEMLARRVQIARMLKEGFTYEEIRNALFVSEGTVASCAQALKRGEGGLNIVAGRLAGVEESAEEDFEEDFEEEEEVAEAVKPTVKKRTAPMLSSMREKPQERRIEEKKAGSLRKMRMGR